LIRHRHEFTQNFLGSFNILPVLVFEEHRVFQCFALQDDLHFGSIQSLQFPLQFFVAVLVLFVLVLKGLYLLPEGVTELLQQFVLL